MPCTTHLRQCAFAPLLRDLRMTGQMTAATSLDSNDQYSLSVWNEVESQRTTIRLSRQEAAELAWGLRLALSDGRDHAPS